MARALLLLLVMAAALTLPVAGAQRVGIEQVVVGDERCRGFLVEGSGFPVAEGAVEVWQDRPAPEPDVKLEEHPWRGEPEGAGTFGFVAGPFTPAVQEDVVVRVRGAGDEVLATTSPFDLLCAAVLDCPEASATAEYGGAVRLEWGDVEGANVYEVRREPPPVPGGSPIVFTGGGPGRENAFTDLTNRPGETFRYTVDAFGPDLARSGGCPALLVTAIPFFGTPHVVALALAGACGAYLLARRR